MVNKNVIFVLRGVKAKQLIVSRLGEMPREFAFGFDHVENFNCQCIILPTEIKGFFAKIFKFFEMVFSKITNLGFPFYSYLLFEKKDKEKLKEAGVIFCTDEAIGFAFLLYKKLGLIKSRVIVLVMSLPERIKDFRKNKLIIGLIKILFKSADKVLTLSKYVQPALVKDFDISSKIMQVFYFGIDIDFWKPLRNEMAGDFILSIGNDMNRDFQTLITALPDNTELKLVTKKKVNTTSKKIEILSGITDEEVRRLYCKSQFVVVPSIRLKNESSGLSCTLQAMACKKAVILSDTPTMRELFVDGKECLFYKPENIEDLGEKIDLLIKNSTLRKTLEINGFEKVTRFYTCKNMGKRLEYIINSI